MTETLRGHARRLVVLLGAIVIVNFALPRALPGSPIRTGGADGATAILPKDAVDEIRRLYALDEPLGHQFMRYLHGLARLDLGTSLATHRPVTAMIRERLPWTLLLVGSAVAVSSVLGIVLGTLAAWRPDRRAPRLAAACVVAVGALPEFLLAMALIALGTASQRFPVGGAVSPFLTVAGARDVWRAAADALASRSSRSC
jgi:peptide/nickel transport system permease protein